MTSGTCVAGGAEFSGFVVDEGDDFPECNRDLEVEAGWIAGSDVRYGMDNPV